MGWTLSDVGFFTLLIPLACLLFFLATIHLFLSQKFGCCVVIIVIPHNAAGPAYVEEKKI